MFNKKIKQELEKIKTEVKNNKSNFDFRLDLFKERIENIEKRQNANSLSTVKNQQRLTEKIVDVSDDFDKRLKVLEERQNTLLRMILSKPVEIPQKWWEFPAFLCLTALGLLAILIFK